MFILGVEQDDLPTAAHFSFVGYQLVAKSSIALTPASQLFRAKAFNTSLNVRTSCRMVFCASRQPSFSVIRTISRPWNPAIALVIYQGQEGDFLPLIFSNLCQCHPPYLEAPSKIASIAL